MEDRHDDPGGAGVHNLSDGDKDFVRIPRAVFTRTVKKMHEQESQLMAAKSLHALMKEKDDALRESERKNMQLQEALDRSNTHINSLCARSFGASGLPRCTSKKPDETGTTDSDLETDCCELQRDTLIYQNPPSVSELSAAKLAFDSRTVSPCALPPSVKSTMPSVSSSMSSAPVPTSVSLHSMASAAYSAESRDLHDKLMQQNAQLRKAIRDILADKGISVSQYLDRQEFEDVAGMLRQDLKRSQEQVERLKSIIKSHDSNEVDQLSVRCAQLEENLMQSERRYKMLQAYADAIKQAYDKVVLERTSPKSQSESQTPNAVSLEEQLQNLQKFKAESSEAQTRLKKENAKLTSDLENASKEIEALKRKCSEHMEEKHKLAQLIEDNAVLQSQISAYKEDFDLERKEKVELKQRLERAHSEEMQKLKKQFEGSLETLAKHQEWVRRLSEETRTCRASWETEKAKREDLERKIQQYMSTQSRFEMPKPCHAEVDKSFLPSYRSRDVVADSPVSLNQQPPSASLNQPKQHVCPRCDRTFESHEVEKFQQHVKRCTDD